MRPTFRTDLVCSREEQQGVVFYRIDDPKSQTSFRLYEIEYLIAKKLDGSRVLPDVITAVKKDFNFDITEADLQRFVNQLDSMGFLVGGRSGTEEMKQPVELETQVMDRKKKEDDIELLEPAAMAPEASDADKAELDRLLRSAFLHVKQGYIVHARDYFLAAKELKPTDERLQKIVNHLEIIGDASGPAEVEYLWNQAKELFPDMAAEVGPLLDAKSGGPSEVQAKPAIPRTTGGWDEDLRSRIIWTLILVAVLVVGIGGLVWVIKAARIFEKAARVKVTTVKADRIPIFFEKPASSVKPQQEDWLTAPVAGKVAQVLVTTGSRVEAGLVLVTMDLPPAVEKQLEQAKLALQKADENLAKASDKANQLLAEREAIETERTSAEDRLKELRPKSLLRQGGVSKRDLEKWKRLKVAANKKLSALAKKERAPKAAKSKADLQRQAAARKLDALEKKISNKLIRAPFAGLVVEIKVSPGASVNAADKLVLFRDPTNVQLTFEVPKTATLQVGGETHIAVGTGKPSRAKIGEVKPGDVSTLVVVRLADPSGGFLDFEPAKFKLVREFAEPAFRIPASSLVEDDRGVHVVVAMQKRALEREVIVLERDLASAVVTEASGSLRDGEQIVVARLDEGEVKAIADGSFLEVEAE
jgi:HlyD family secretion protein